SCDSPFRRSFGPVCSLGCIGCEAPLQCADRFARWAAFRKPQRNQHPSLWRAAQESSCHLEAFAGETARAPYLHAGSCHPCEDRQSPLQGYRLADPQTKWSRPACLTVERTQSRSLGSLCCPYRLHLKVQSPPFGHVVSSSAHLTPERRHRRAKCR